MQYLQMHFRYARIRQYLKVITRFVPYSLSKYRSIAWTFRFFILFIFLVVSYRLTASTTPNRTQISVRTLAAIRAARRYDADADRFVKTLCRQVNCSKLGSGQHSTTRATSVAVIQYVETKYNGFGAQFLRMVDASALAYLLGARFEFVTSKYWNYGCAPWHGWTCYFVGQNIKMRENCVPLEHWIVNTDKSCVSVATDMAAARASAILRNLPHLDALNESRRLARRSWSLNKRTMRDVARMHSTVNLPRSNDYIGVHVRRGDKKSEVPLVSIAKYVSAVRCVDPIGVSPVYIATDDGAIISELRALLAPRTILSLPGVESRHGHSQLATNQHYLKRNRFVMTQLIVEVEVLRRARWFVGTFSSNMGRLVHLLRNNNSVSLDDRWATGVAWRTFGTTYCGSEGAEEMFCQCQV